MKTIRHAQARWGHGAVLLGVTVLAVLLAVMASQIMVSVLAFGDRPTAAWTAGLCAAALSACGMHLLLSQVDYQRQSELDLTRHASLDPLTGVFNRRHFLNLVEREWSLARRYDTACALLVIDVDHFKRVNDGFGHLCGDLLLRQIAEACSETLRQADVLARFGGEEFILFLPHTDPLGALDVALDQLVHEAEDALDVAKADGRNCVRAGEGLLPGKPSSLIRN